MNIIIRAKPGTVAHKTKEKLLEGWCWWTVRGKPKKISKGEKVLFGHEGRVHAEGKVISVDFGFIYMEPLKKVSYPWPCVPPTRGYKYVS